MRHLVVLFIYLVAVLTQLFQPGGVRSVVAESLLHKHQLLIVNRSRPRSLNLSLANSIQGAGSVIKSAEAVFVV